MTDNETHFAQRNVHVSFSDSVKQSAEAAKALGVVEIENEYHPTCFVDISDFIEQKKKALSCYGEKHDRMNRLFTMNIERNHIWGYSNEVEYAEGFRVIKILD